MDELDNQLDAYLVITRYFWVCRPIYQSKMRIPEQLVASTDGAVVEGAQVLFVPMSGSLSVLNDTVVVFHNLEVAGEPHQVLREIPACLFPTAM